MRQSGHSRSLLSSTARTLGERAITHGPRSARPPRPQCTSPNVWPSSCTASFASRRAVSARVGAVDEPRHRHDRRRPFQLRLAEHEGQHRDEQVHVGDARASARPAGAVAEQPRRAAARDECWPPPRRRACRRAVPAASATITSRENCSASRSRTAPTSVGIERAVPDPPQRDRPGPPPPGRHAAPCTAPATATPASRWRLGTGQRQADRDRRPRAGRAVDRQAPAVAFDDPVDHRQPEPRALLLGREERVEHLRQLLGRECPTPVSRDRDRRSASRPRRAASAPAACPRSASRRTR